MTDSLIVATDGDLWILNKPAGLLVHPGEDPSLPDLMKEAIAQGAPASIAPCHRLDLETSGLVLASPDAAVRGQIGRWLADGQLVKRYRALVYGRTRKKGTVSRPLPDARRGRSLRATTRYRKLEWLGPLTLVSVRPESGRKHQIRRHLQSIGHALVGDDRYPPKRRRAVPAFPGRLWLHASSIELPDRRFFEAPLAPELAAHLEVLRGIGASESDRV